jgi:hypothetical protein
VSERGNEALKRMSEVDSGDWKLISRHLDHLLDLPEPERAAYLSTLMRDHPELAERLERLLSIGSQHDFRDFLAERPALVMHPMRLNI